MSRIRSIKPSFWSSEKVMALPRDVRLFFIGIWNFSDDAGRFKWSAATLRAQILPGDLDVTVSQVEDWLSLLVQGGLLERYRNVPGKLSADYGNVLGWDHQKISKPQPSKYPNPQDCQIVASAFPDSSRNVPGMVPEDSRTDWRGEEGRGEGAAAAPPRAPACVPARADVPPRAYVMQPEETPDGAAAAAASSLREFGESEMRETFAETYFALRKAPPNMHGSVNGLHGEVLATAKARNLEPAVLFKTTVHRWALGELNEKELRHPWTCFAAAWGSLLERVNGHALQDKRAELVKKSLDAMARRDLKGYAEAEKELGEFMRQEDQHAH